MIEKLYKVIPTSVWSQLNDIMSDFEINTNLRLAHFLAQCAHESMDFKVTSENLNYSSAGLLSEWPMRFTETTAAKYAHNQQAIANHVYGGRMGNGDEASGDGWKYRGRGFIGITGKALYEQCSKGMGIPDDLVANPDLVSTKYPLVVSAYFWKNKGLNELADAGPTDLAVTKISKSVNGGLTGLSSRIQHFHKFWEILK